MVLSERDGNRPNGKKIAVIARLDDLNQPESIPHQLYVLEVDNLASWGSRSVWSNLPRTIPYMKLYLVSEDD